MKRAGEPKARGRFPSFLTLGLAELGLTVTAALAVDTGVSFPAYLALYVAMGLPWLLATRAVVRRREGGATATTIFVFALLMRAVFLVTEPVLSDDIYRYRWDGRVAGAGINPYIHAPEAPELAFLRDDLYPGINNKDIPTIYPPLMELVFRLVTAVSESLFAMKGFFVLVDLALLFVLRSLLSTRGLDEGRVLVYAWCPLPIVEVAGSGHNDVLGALGLFAALLALARGREALSVGWLTLAGLAKLVGFALLPLFARFVRLRALAVVPVLSLAFAWPYRQAGARAFDGLTQYGLRWRGNDSLFHVLYALTDSLAVSKVIVAVTLVTLTLVLAVQKVRPLRASYLVIGAILMLTATVHPWYLLWILPFLCFYPSPAWLYLALGVGLSYHAAYLSTPGEPWEELLWVKLLEYVPFYALGLAGFARGFLRRRASAQAGAVGLDSPLP
jgi:alpha-1,6-mannosyltransferase